MKIKGIANNKNAYIPSTKGIIKRSVIIHLKVILIPFSNINKQRG
jgi:hypothetical protein